MFTTVNYILQNSHYYLHSLMFVYILT